MFISPFFGGPPPATGGGTDVTPVALAFTSISGTDFASGNVQTITGINTPITLQLTHSGSGAIYYNVNGAGFNAYSAPFVVNNGDTLQLAAAYPGGASPKTGTISVVNNSDSNAVIGSCSYFVPTS